MKWAFLGDLLPRILQPVSTIVLARLLTPADYGIIGIAASVAGLAGTVQGMGLSQALVQTDENVEGAADVVFWSNLGQSLLLYAIVFSTAPLLAVFFDEPRLISVIRVIGLKLVLSAFDDVQAALLARDFGFRRLAIRQAVPAVTPALVSIPLALSGFGYWSLVAGTLAGTALGVIWLWSVAEWRPRLRFDVRVARSLFGFGALVTVQSLQAMALSYGDRLAAGHFLGVENLGYYTFALLLIRQLMGFVILPLERVAYSAFSRLRTEREELQRLFIESTQILAVIVFPLALGLSLAAEPVVSVAFGEKWQPAIPVIRILAIMAGLSWVGTLHPTLYRALGRPDVMPKFYVGVLLYSIPAYVIGGQLGLTGFSLMRGSVSLISTLQMLISVKLLKLPWKYLWHCIRSPLFAGLIMSGVVSVLVALLGPYDSGWQSGGNLVIIVASGAAAYGLALWLIDRVLFWRFMRRARQAI